jgi:hypothetical protein
MVITLVRLTKVFLNLDDAALALCGQDISRSSPVDDLLCPSYQISFEPVSAAVRTLTTSPLSATYIAKFGSTFASG